MDKERIAVGDSARLEILYSTKSSIGKTTKTPRITIKGSDLPRSVQISATVLANPDSAYPVAVKPYKLDISQFGEKKRTEITFTLTNRSPEDLKIELVAHDPSFFTPTLPKTIKANGEATGTVKIKSEKVGESFDKSLTFAASPVNGSNQQPVRFTVPVKRTVRTLSAKADSLSKSVGANKASGGH